MINPQLHPPPLKLGLLFYNQNAQIVCWVLQNTMAFSHFVFYHKNNKMDLADGTCFQHKSLLLTAEFADFAQNWVKRRITERQITLKLDAKSTMAFLVSYWVTTSRLRMAVACWKCGTEFLSTKCGSVFVNFWLQRGKYEVGLSL